MEYAIFRNDKQATNNQFRQPPLSGEKPIMKKDSQNNRRLGRRDFLANAAVTVGLTAVLGLAGTYGVRYLVPRARKKTFVDVLVSNVGELAPGGAREFIDGRGRKGIIINHAGQIKAFSKICTHLGCEVEWHDQTKQFYCPCHEGFFAADGRNIKGPPPRPLDEYKVTLKDDNIYVAIEKV
ncbi:MAG TPA: ubiquinol-cytochrome c reductase iron-sulfur subunit [Proteobacteria bacterium]|nr:ubiquinol-cytochrome c reductase iron-sulfur subunit [Pseudomonadota bacterium]